MPGRPEAGFPISDLRLWDAPSLIKAYYEDSDCEPPAVPGRPNTFPASAGRVGRRLDFRQPEGCAVTSELTGDLAGHSLSHLASRWDQSAPPGFNEAGKIAITAIAIIIITLAVRTVAIAAIITIPS